MTKNNRMPKRSRASKSASLSALKPPGFTASVASSHKFRFKVTSTVDNDYAKSSDLLNLLLMNTGSSTTYYRLIQGIKIKKVSMWAYANSATPVTLNMQWTSEYGPAKMVSDTSGGSTYPAHISSTPPVNSAASFWRISGVDETQVIFTIDAPIGTIIDVDCDLYLQDNVTGLYNPVAVTGAVTGTLGIMYGSALDQSNSAVIKPEGLLSVA
jgi:hypothetical protein